MRTEDLIDALTRGDEGPLRRSNPWPRALAFGLLAALVLLVAIIRPRADLGEALPATLAKAAFAAVFAALALSAAMRLAKSAPARNRFLMLGALLAASLAAAGIALWGEDPARRMAAWTGGGFPWCLILIPVLAAPFAAALGMAVRRFAPTNLSLTGAALGAASGGLGAMVYAMHCPVDSVAFVTTWYAIAIAIAAALGAALAGRFLRW